MEAEIGVMLPRATGRLGARATTGSRDGGLGQSLPGASSRDQPCGPPELGCLASRVWENKVPLFRATGFVALCHGGLRSLLRLPSSVHGPPAPSLKALKAPAPLHCEQPRECSASDALSEP